MDDLVLGGVTRFVTGRGIAADPAAVLAGSPERVAVFAQPPTAAIGGDLERAIASGGAAAATRILPDGEAAKSLAVVEEAADWLNSLGLTRTDHLVAVGGGAITDAVGFLASVYLRGIGVTYVTTTLLGAVDASIGGKTALNVGGKNLIGTFRHPDVVVVDLDVLQALPDDLLRQGMAEAAKTGLIGDPGLVEILEEDGLGADLEAVVRRAASVKAGVVGRDFREAGERAHLNLGHTIGHALETATGWSHGDAVSVGLVAAVRASAIETGFASEERVHTLLGRLGLPRSAPTGVGRDQIRALMRMDKKRVGDGVRMVLLREVGVPTVVDVPPATVAAALDAIGVTE